MNQRILRRVTFAFFAAATTTFAACSDVPNWVGEEYCGARCACEKCTQEQLDACNDDVNKRSDETKTNTTCFGEFSVYLECLSNKGRCENGAYNESYCTNENAKFESCLNAMVCPSTYNGICDEPAPLGTGKCVAGGDKADCSGGICSTTNNGICDEIKGTGTCPVGTDTVDCSGPTPTCATANDGTCDEPGGTGKCLAGTDTEDCKGGTCIAANNGICDEPGGTGKCLVGTDPADCPCDYKEDGSCDEPQGTGLCAAGTDAFDCLTPTCATTNDGICDESKGTGNCPMDTDTTDCALPCVTCAEYVTDPQSWLCTMPSASIYEELMLCACDGPCKSDCGGNLCVGVDQSMTCGMCLQTGACSAQFGACANDL